jgi:hypothetical protein
MLGKKKSRVEWNSKPFCSRKRRRRHNSRREKMED